MFVGHETRRGIFKGKGEILREVGNKPKQYMQWEAEKGLTAETEETG